MKRAIEVFIIIVVGLIFLKVGEHFYYKKTEELRAEIKKERIRADELIKVNEGYYQKLVADTLTKKQLKKQVDSLQLAVKNPIIVEKIKFIPKDIEKPVDGIIVKDSIISTEDYYPKQGEDYFVKYTSEINIKTQKGVGKFSFGKPISLNLAIGEQKDGTYRVDTRLPDYINIESIDVQALPMTPQKKDNFGLLIGAGAGKDFKDNSTYLQLTSGIRYKKVYLNIGAGTNKTINGTVTFEF